MISVSRISIFKPSQNCIVYYVFHFCDIYIHIFIYLHIKLYSTYIKQYFMMSDVFKCTLCSKIFATNASLIQHVRHKHAKVIMPEVSNKETTTNEPKSIQSAILNAPTSAMYPNISEIENVENLNRVSRVARIVQLKILKCPDCQFKTESKDLYSYHIIAVHRLKSSVFVCDTCYHHTIYAEEMFSHRVTKHNHPSSKPYFGHSTLVSYNYIPYCKICKFASFGLESCPCGVPTLGRPEEWSKPNSLPIPKANIKQRLPRILTEKNIASQNSFSHNTPSHNAVSRKENIASITKSQKKIEVPISQKPSNNAVSHKENIAQIGQILKKIDVPIAQKPNKNANVLMQNMPIQEIAQLNLFKAPKAVPHARRVSPYKIPKLLVKSKTDRLHRDPRQAALRQTSSSTTSFSGHKHSDPRRAVPRKAPSPPATPCSVMEDELELDLPFEL